MYTRIISIIVVCFAYSSCVRSMEKTENNHHKIASYVKGAASIGAITGGWGFFAAGATKKTGKPRFPKIQPHGRKALAIFLVSNTILQGMNFITSSKKQ
ncbi:MAG TPA: hypothetical protein VEK38_00105 [Candidatus Bathyarchaeia archaeon]|nr:hypothetical protein [Candidatus Bathyarchaeia archaeon]